MKIGVIGAGRIGGNAARLLAGAGHEVLLSFSRDPARLRDRAAAIGGRARAGEVREAVGFGDVVILSVPWTAIPTALEQTGPLDGKIVIDARREAGAADSELLSRPSRHERCRLRPLRADQPSFFAFSAFIISGHAVCISGCHVDQSW